MTLGLTLDHNEINQSSRSQVRDISSKVDWTIRKDSEAPYKISLKQPTLGQLLESTFPTRHYLLHPWLRQQESAMIFAETGIGKSLVGLSIALAVAGQGKFLNWESKAPPEKSFRVLYVDGEMHIQDIQERAAMLMETIQGLNVELACRNLEFLSRQHQDSGKAFPSITEDSGRDFYLQDILKGGFDLVIYDNFTTLGDVEDENSASSFNSIQEFLLAHKTQGVATILIHHAGKNGTFRGSSKLAATFESIIQLEKIESPSEDQGALFRLSEFKDRSGRGIKPMIVRLIKSNPFNNSPARWEFESNLSRLEVMKENLQKGCYITQKEIADEFGISPQMTGKDITRGVELGLWTQQDISQWLRKGKAKRGRESAALAKADAFNDDF